MTETGKLRDECQQLARSLCEPGAVRVELGAGGRTMPGWVSIDNSTDAAIHCDISVVGVPFQDGGVDEIYSSHFFEHLSYPNPMTFVFSECMRVLRPGGVFKIAVPDASIYIRAYMNKEDFPEVIPVYKPAFFFNTPIDSINYIAYMAGEHKHMFDMENLLQVMRQAGFVDVAERSFEEGLDTLRRKPQTIYAVGIRP